MAARAWGGVSWFEWGGLVVTFLSAVGTLALAFVAWRQMKKIEETEKQEERVELSVAVYADLRRDLEGLGRIVDGKTGHSRWNPQSGTSFSAWSRFKQGAPHLVARVPDELTGIVEELDHRWGEVVHYRGPVISRIQEIQDDWKRDLIDSEEGANLPLMVMDGASAVVQVASFDLWAELSRFEDWLAHVRYDYHLDRPYAALRSKKPRPVSKDELQDLSARVFATLLDDERATKLRKAMDVIDQKRHQALALVDQEVRYVQPLWTGL